MKRITIKNSRLILLFLILGCTKVSDLEHVLTNNTQKPFWVEMKSNLGKLEYTNHQWLFYSDGSAECLLSFNPKQKGYPIIFNIHKQHGYEWKYEPKDNILDLGPGVKYKIIRCKTDTVFMTTWSRDSIVLIRNY